MQRSLFVTRSVFDVTTLCLDNQEQCSELEGRINLDMCLLAGADLFNIFVKYCTFGRAERSEEMTSNQVWPGSFSRWTGCALIGQ